MSDERLLLKNYLKTLKLPTVRVEYEAVARRCNQADASYEEFLVLQRHLDLFDIDNISSYKMLC